MDGGRVTASAASPWQRPLVSRPYWLLGGMLLSLHVALAWGVQAWWSAAAFLVHFGLFLLWQPVWRSERALPTGYALLVVLCGGAMLALWHSWWLATLWIGILVGLVGGDVVGTTGRWRRIGHFLSLLYLLSMLLVWVVPHLFSEATSNPVLTWMVRYGLALPAFLVVFIPQGKQDARQFYAVDFIYTLLLLMLVAVLVLGSFAVKVIGQSNYPMALAETLLAIAGALLALNWLWNPHARFAGAGQLLSRYLLSVGLPFERWLRNLAALAEQEPDPVAFLRLALEDIATLSWVAGGEWQAPGGGGNFGTATQHRAEYHFHRVTLVLYTPWKLGPALVHHGLLLTQLLGYFFEAKHREREQRQNAYTQAIYETGARLTHDVKNLLQSMKTLCAAVESSDADQAAALQALLQKQLPKIVQRLQSTLDKLKAPQADAGDAERVSASAWWNGLQQRYVQERIEFGSSAMEQDVRIPGDLFDSVSDNLLQNALAKRKGQPGLVIRAEFSCEGGGRLMVCDDGAPLDQTLAEQLLAAPVKSERGLGIGLYQAARQARLTGYRLSLISNQTGRVCFELAGM